MWCCASPLALLLLLCLTSLLLLQGVYYGGLPAAVDLVRSGLAKPEDFKLLLGMTGERIDNVLHSRVFLCHSNQQHCVYTPLEVATFDPRQPLV
jgi:hypothetical protein